MLTIDLRRPPETADPNWLWAFAARMMQADPTLAPGEAMCHALRAHACSWLLEPEEAASLWAEAVERRRPPDKPASAGSRPARKSRSPAR